MIVKNKIYTPSKMVKGVVGSKQAEGNYFHGKNLRFETHKDVATGGFVLEKGNALHLSLPKITVDYASTSFKYSVGGVAKQLSYIATEPLSIPRCDIESDFADQSTSEDFGPQVIIGSSITRDGLVLFSTNDHGFDCVWYVLDSGAAKQVELKYCRNLNFSTQSPIQAISNYENQNIDKTYWIDGKSQQRSVNIKDNNLANLKTNVLNMVGDFNLSKINIVDTFAGGSHTAGVIQYAYNLYRVNGSQTKISPLSELVSLDKGINGGGELNEVVSKTVSLRIDDLDSSYTNIKLYAVKYTSYNQAPSVSILLDQSIPQSGTVECFDDGSVILGISNETFLFLGGEIIIPESMEVKTNRVIFTNYTERSYDLINNANENVADGCRAFSYDAAGVCKIADSMTKASNGSQLGIDIKNPNTDLIPSNFSCINIDYNTYKYHKTNNLKVGGTAKFLEYTLTRSRVTDANFDSEDAKGRFYKDGELYRASIQFYSKYGEVSTPKWIADFVTEQTSQGNLTGYYGTMEVKLLPAFYAWLNTVSEELRPVGFKILRAERKSQDKTIIAQGIINGMIATGQAGNDRAAETVPPSQGAIDFCHATNTIKIPSMIRNFGDILCPMLGSKTYLGIPGKKHPQGYAAYGQHGAFRNNTSEIYHKRSSSDARRMSYQFNKLMQFNCPEIEFDLLSKINSNKLSVIGMLKSTANNWWGKELHVTSKAITSEVRTNNCISPSDIKAFIPGNVTAITNGTRAIQDFGLIGPSGREDRYDNHQFYREYNNDRTNASGAVIGGFVFKKKDYDIFGSPEIAERGAGKASYKRDARLSYSNSLEGLGSDTAEEVDDIKSPGIDKVNSWVCKSAFVALGADNVALENRTAIEDIYRDLQINEPSGIIMCEFKITDLIKYVGGLYGGNSYEDKKRTNYVEIGSYNDILDDTIFIKSPGDTFVGNYKFERISKNGTESADCRICHVTEIVSYTTETSIDLNRRSDLSIADWDNKFMPPYADYKKYNRVYSQDSNFIYRRDNEYTFKAVKTFETSIIATKEKIPNEPIDSWTDVLINEQISLDGRYGPINALLSYKDEIFAFQDRAVARLSISPRVQISGNDGIAVQLGTGQLFNGYTYITTKSGSINKWGVIATEKGMYYIDALNKSLIMINESEMVNLSDREEFHEEFQRIIHEDFIRTDNPILKKGVSMGYDQITKDVYVSLFNNEGCVTLSFNESKKGFTSYYDYDAPMYIFNKKEMLTISPKNPSAIFKCFEGLYNVFYGERKESIYALLAAPEPFVECIFNNIEYNSISKDISDNETLDTWRSVRLYNEFQDSGIVDLVDRDNIRKKNRQHRISLPRNQNSRNKIRNNWAIIELRTSNPNENKMLMHDIILYYTPNYIVIQ